jgi:hypothetical protein
VNERLATKSAVFAESGTAAPVHGIKGVFTQNTNFMSPDVAQSCATATGLLLIMSCNIAQHCATLGNIAQHRATLRNIAQHRATLHNIAQHRATSSDIKRHQATSGDKKFVFRVNSPKSSQ